MLLLKVVRTMLPLPYPPQVISLVVLSVADQFKASWRHSGTTCPPVRRIYKILAPQASLANYNTYKYVLTLLDPPSAILTVYFSPGLSELQSRLAVSLLLLEDLLETRIAAGTARVVNATSATKARHSSAPQPLALYVAS